MHDEAFLRCARCGDRIGVYEPVMLLDVAGWVLPSSVQAVREGRAAGQADLGVAHEACVRPAQAAPAWRGCDLTP